jgi:antitoxin PrlF
LLKLNNKEVGGKEEENSGDRYRKEIGKAVTGSEGLTLCSTYGINVLPMNTYPTQFEMSDMNEQLTIVTRKGQVTIPADIRRALGIKEGDKVAFVLEDDQVTLTRKGSVVEQTAGALKSDMPALTPQEERAATEQAIAEEALERSRS